MDIALVICLGQCGPCLGDLSETVWTLSWQFVRGQCEHCFGTLSGTVWTLSWQFVRDSVDIVMAICLGKCENCDGTLSGDCVNIVLVICP